MTGTVNKQDRVNQGNGKTVEFMPRVDLAATQEGLQLFVDLPGARQEDIDVQYQDGELVIEANVPVRHKAERYLLREYGVGNYRRSFRLDDSIDASGISAEYKLGVLSLYLPKREALKAKRIAIQSN